MLNKYTETFKNIWSCLSEEDKKQCKIFNEYETLLEATFKAQKYDELITIVGGVKLKNKKSLSKAKEEIIINNTKQQTAKEILELVSPNCDICDSNWLKGCRCFRKKMEDIIKEKYNL